MPKAFRRSKQSATVSGSAARIAEEAVTSSAAPDFRPHPNCSGRDAWTIARPSSSISTRWPTFVSVSDRAIGRMPPLGLTRGTIVQELHNLAAWGGNPSFTQTCSQSTRAAKESGESSKIRICVGASMLTPGADARWRAREARQSAREMARLGTLPRGVGPGTVVLSIASGRSSRRVVTSPGDIEWTPCPVSTCSADRSPPSRVLVTTEAAFR